MGRGCLRKPPGGGRKGRHMGRYDDIYRRSLEHPEEFWAEAAAAIDWDEPWTRVLDDSRAPFYRWFSGGRLNTCHNALDRHVEGGRADQLALILRGTVRRIADGDEYTTPPTIDDPAILDEMKDALRELGYTREHAASVSGN